MALEITKEDLVKAIPSTPAPSNTVNTILNFLNTPTVQDIMKRILDRIMPVKNPEAPATTPGTSIQATVKDKINYVLEFLDKVPDEMTKLQIKNELEKTRASLGV